MDPIRDHFDSGRPGAAENCPDSARIAAFAAGALDDAAHEQILAHTVSCPACSEKTAVAAKLLREAPERAPAASLHRRAASRGLSPERRVPGWVWPAGFALFMTLSFLLPKYFMQMLVAAVVFAGKWLIESRARVLRVDVTHRTEGGSGDDHGGRRGEGGASRRRDLRAPHD